MNAASQLITLDKANAGMTLATDLRDDSGGMLLPAGATLTDASINSLRRRGIESLTIVAEAEAPDPAVLEALREQRRARLRVLFRRSFDAGATPSLLQSLEAYRNSETA